jgi:hypothetical protein
LFVSSLLVISSLFEDLKDFMIEGWLILYLFVGILLKYEVQPQ